MSDHDGRMLTDYHTHSRRCGHAAGTMAEYVDAAIARGIDEIGLSDHFFLYFQEPAKRSSRWAMAEEEFSSHYDEMCELRARHDRIRVRVAVEVDYMPDHEDALRSLLAPYKFDYILGGVHFLDDWMIDDADQSDRYRRERLTEIYRRYYSVLRRGIVSGLFDVVAHFDLPKKFGFLPEDDLSAEIGETLDAAAEHNIAIELSTAGLRKPIAELYPSAAILREIARRNIAVVLSSDAHAPHEVGYAFDAAAAALSAAGIRQIATFEQRVMQRVSREQ